MADERLRIDVKDDPSRQMVLVTLTGRIDIFTYRDLNKALDALSEDKPGMRMAVDLSGVPFVASSGWSVFIAMRSRFRRLEGQFVVAGMNEELGRVFRSMKLPDLISAYKDMAEAEAALVETTREMRLLLKLDVSGGLLPALVDRVQASVEAALLEAGLSKAVCYAAANVVEELCTNIMDHSGAAWLELSCRIFRGQARLRIRDNGKPFSPCEAMREQARNFDLKAVVDRRLGLYMIRRLTQSFTCSRDSEGCNVVEFEVSRDLEKDARDEGGEGS